MAPNTKTEEDANVATSYGSIEYSYSNLSETQTPVKKRYGFIPTWYLKELWEVFDIAWSMVLLSLFQTLFKPISMIFIRPYGTFYLGGIGLANTIINVSGFKIGGGLATACDTLFSQAYGSTNKKKVGVYLQRSMMIIMLCSLPCIAVHLNTESLLILMGQNPKISRLSSSYVLIYLVGVPAFFLFSILKKYLRNLNIVRPLLLVAFSGLAVNILSQFVLVSQLKWGIEGAAISQALATWTLVGFALIYIIASGMYKETWPGWSAEAFQEWGMFIKLAIGSLLMICLQFWAFEIGILLSGTLGDTQLGAQTIVFQLESFVYMLSLGVGIACNIRVGHLLGANRPKQAKRAVLAGYTIVWATAIIIVALLVSLRHYLPMIFSNDKEVIDQAASLIPILALYHIFDSTVGVSTGILRGCGRQTIGAGIIFLGMYVIGLPTGISLMLLTDLKSAGFWWGMTAAMVCEGIILFIAVYRTDWEEQAKMAQVRAGVFSAHRNNIEENEDSGIDSVEDSPNIDERSSLLSSKDDDEDDLDDEDIFPKCEETIKIYKLPNSLTCCQLIVRRGAFIGTMFSLLGLGIFTRFYFPPSSVEPLMCRISNRTGDNTTSCLFVWTNSTHLP